MAKKHKRNPHNVQATLADVKNAVKYAAQKAIQDSLIIFFTVLADKEGFKTEDLKRVYMEVDSLSQGIQDGYVTVADLKQVLKEEYNIRFSALYAGSWLR